MRCRFVCDYAIEPCSFVFVIRALLKLRRDVNSVELSSLINISSLPFILDCSEKTSSSGRKGRAGEIHPTIHVRRVAIHFCICLCFISLDARTNDAFEEQCRLVDTGKNACNGDHQATTSLTRIRAPIVSGVHCSAVMKSYAWARDGLWTCS